MAVTRQGAGGDEPESTGCVEFDGANWCPTAESAVQLGPSDSGVWLIMTGGTVHVWDLDRRRFCRIPGATTRAAPMPFDRTVQRWTRVQVYPRVGARLVVWFDDPRATGTATMEYYRVSSTIRSIVRLTPERTSPPPVVPDGEAWAGSSPRQATPQRSRRTSVRDRKGRSGEAESQANGAGADGSTQINPAENASSMSPQMAAASVATGRAWSRLDHGLLHTSEVAGLLGEDSRTVETRHAHGDLLAVRRHEHLLFPAYQFDDFDQVYPSVPVLRLIGEKFEWSESSLILWMISPNAYLGGELPVHRIGDTEAIARAARSSFDTSW